MMAKVNNSSMSKAPSDFNWKWPRLQREGLLEFAGITLGSFNYWKQQGLFVTPARGGSAARESYTAFDVAILRVIKSMTQAGLRDSFLKEVVEPDGWLERFITEGCPENIVFVFEPEGNKYPFNLGDNGKGLCAHVQGSVDLFILNPHKILLNVMADFHISHQSHIAQGDGE